jgi:hypothetical protein
MPGKKSEDIREERASESVEPITAGCDNATEILSF